MHDEGIFPIRGKATPRPAGKPLMSHFCLASWVLSVLFACNVTPLRAQQTVIPTQQVPNPGSPEQQRKKTPPIPPGSVLPSYNKVISAPKTKVTPVPASDLLQGWSGMNVAEIRFEGVGRELLEPLPEQLAQQPNMPLDPVKVRDSLRRLYATGLYLTIALDGEKSANGVVLVFDGTPTLFVGRVLVRGVRNNQLSNQLSYSTRLSPGTPFSDARVKRAMGLLQQTLQDNGYYQSAITPHTAVDRTNSEMDVQLNVKTGKPARVGEVAVQGDSGMTIPQFRKQAKLKAGSKVNNETVSRALNDLRKHFQKEQRLEASVSLASRTYQPPTNHLNYDFHADRGPVIQVMVEGVSLSKGKIRNLVPVYAEGTLDEDLLNEGSKRIRDYFQREGYFEAKVTFQTSTAGGVTHITYVVSLGPRDRIDSVSVTGNHYFGTELIQERLGVQPASFFVRHGVYSLALQQADVTAITSLYQSNGFVDVKVTPEVHELSHAPKTGERNLAVTYRIDEGVQQKVGTYNIVGATPEQLAAIRPKLSLQSGQPYSGSNLASNRDTILGYYLDNGYDHAQVNLKQEPSPKNRNLIDVTLNVVPGDQIFIRQVLISGLHYTRRSTVRHEILVQPGRPLDQAKLLETQRQLYNLTLFNQVNTAVENPGGDEPRKNVLIQFDEARRWDVNYGAGFQAQTGTPSTNCPTPASLVALGINPVGYVCNPNGKFGVSALVELDVSRINLFGRNQSLGFRGEYGSLEQEFTANYSSPRFLNHPTLDLSVSAGYINAMNVITFASSTSEGDLRLTHRPNLMDTLIYQISYRRVKVDPNTIQVSPNLIPLLTQPIRVGGPELTWIHDTRRPEPLDARSGMFNSVQVFATDNYFMTSQSNFAHFDWTNSTYYALGKRKNFVLARNTRFGMERAFGENRYEFIPLPERLYAGGPESLRGFPLNAAGPRDAETGFPIGGAGVFVNQTELRLPHPQLPYFGRALGFVLFEDMGNVFNNSSEIWPSAIRIKQPHSYTCTAPQYLTAAAQETVTRSSSTNPTGTCSFDDFSQTVGLGVRYHTPIGPIRFDTGYNLNPPVYPVIVNYGATSTSTSSACENSSLAPPCVGRAGHFNFFFSIGQAF
ncbi:MAG: POTRA domain-containing protein [Acidobacteriaceae bacterium]